ncbi:MAG: GxxExxY protein [Planctomycetota bacterium]
MSETQRRKEAKPEQREEKKSYFAARARIVGEWDDGSGDETAEDACRQVIGAAIEVHRVLGPGLPEVLYEKALGHELTLQQVSHRRQAPVPVTYKGVVVGEGFMDLLVQDRLVVELKVVDDLHPLHLAQVRAYLSAARLRLGLLINFNVPILRDGIRRVINPHTSF